MIRVSCAPPRTGVPSPLDDEDDPRRWLRLGFDDVGRVLELVILAFDSGAELVIHAMKARAQYVDLLP